MTYGKEIGAFMGGEISRWIERYEYGDIIVFCLFGIAILSLLAVLGWAYFVIDIEFGVDNIKEAVLKTLEAMINEVKLSQN